MDPMRRYLFHRFLLFLPTIFGLVTLVFLLGRALPGDPVEVMLGENASPEARAELRKALRLDEPVAIQYAGYLGDLATGHLGTSIRTGRPVATEVGEAFPHTAELGLTALLLACCAALPLGLLAGRLPGTPADGAVRFLSSLGLALPSFFVGPLLLLGFAVLWPLFPVSGADEPGALVLPAVTLALPLAAGMTRILRASLVTERGREYLQTARMKGLDEPAVFRRHALRNALLPPLTVLGLQIGAVLTGAILVERIFRWPGMGTLVVTAIKSRDYPVVQGAVLCFALAALAASLAADLLYAWADPRVRYA
jgi:peptide/nickel transport system permease protein